MADNLPDFYQYACLEMILNLYIDYSREMLQGPKAKMTRVEDDWNLRICWNSKDTWAWD